MPYSTRGLYRYTCGILPRIPHTHKVHVADLLEMVEIMSEGFEI